MKDTIYREDAIKAVAEVLSLNRFASFKDIKDFHRFAERVLRNVPSADRPQGEWIDTGKDPSHSHPLTAIWYRCSECGDGTNTKTNYCPSCGARMKGADDEV